MRKIFIFFFSAETSIVARNSTRCHLHICKGDTEVKDAHERPNSYHLFQGTICLVIQWFKKLLV